MAIAPDQVLSQAALAGFVFGLGLIFSLGPQNLALLRAGMTRSHPLAVASTAYASEILLVGFAIGGLAAALASQPSVGWAMQLLGVAFLVWCGLRTLARTRSKPLASAGASAPEARMRSVSHMLVLTWLNPLVYLEAVLLVGMLASGFDGKAQVSFALGFLAASAVKFYGWSLVGGLLSDLATQPAFRTWLDRAAGVILLTAALLLGMHLMTVA